jgi:hypothetical protein
LIVAIKVNYRFLPAQVVLGWENARTRPLGNFQDKNFANMEMLGLLFC